MNRQGNLELALRLIGQEFGLKRTDFWPFWRRGPTPDVEPCGIDGTLQRVVGVKSVTSRQARMKHYNPQEWFGRPAGSVSRET